MRFISTKSDKVPASLSDAINHCVAPDGGLYMPESIPVIPRALFNNISEMSLREIAYVVSTAFFGDDVPAHELKKIVDESFMYDVPMLRIADNRYVLELFHGPTLTFKDFGARFMARLMKYIDRKSNTPCRNVLVATMGNTGAAAANGLLKVNGINVCVLYPHGVLSRPQTAQFTSLGENVHPIEVAGTVEDCKRLVQSALADSSLSDFHLTGANSINLARLLPQVTFAMYAYARLCAMGVENASEAYLSIPCGNLSNLVAAVIALKMGTPIGRLIAATNANNQLEPIFNGSAVQAPPYQPVHTLASSIDMSWPSGWPRLQHLYQGDREAMRRDIICAAPVSDERISQTVAALCREKQYIIDTHGAVAYAGADEAPAGVPVVVFATGHPAKQLDTMTRLTGTALEMPVQLTRFMSMKRHSIIIPPTVPALRKHLLTLVH